MKVKELEQTLRNLLASKEPDATMRTQLETLAQAERSFSGFTWLWGPPLYRRKARTEPKDETEDEEEIEEDEETEEDEKETEEDDIDEGEEDEDGRH